MRDTNEREPEGFQGRLVPAARMDDIVTTETGSEILVYDEHHHHIHHLNPTATAIWRLCDGRRTVSDIARTVSSDLGESVDENAVLLALSKLDEANLLASPLSPQMRVTHSRRGFMRRAAVAGAAAIPTIASISAPNAAAAECVGCTFPNNLVFNCEPRFLGRCCSGDGVGGGVCKVDGSGNAYCGTIP